MPRSHRQIRTSARGQTVRPVRAKIARFGMTSDGYPADEFADVRRISYAASRPAATVRDGDLAVFAPIESVKVSTVAPKRAGRRCSVDWHASNEARRDCCQALMANDTRK